MSAELAALAQLNERFLRDFPHEAARALEKLPVPGMVELLGHQSTEAQLATWQALSADCAAAVLSALPRDQAVELLAGAEAPVIQRALSNLPATQRDALLVQLPESLGAELRAQLDYPAGSAGHLMDPRTGAVNANLSVDEAIDRLRANRHRGLRELFVVDDQVRLVGQVELEDLLLTARDRPLREITHPAPLVVRELDRASHIVKQVQLQPVYAVPVVDASERLVGVIRQSELMTAARLHASIDLQTLVAAGAGERALSSPFSVVGHRLPWLLFSLLTVFLASATAGLFEGTLARFSGLAVLLPLILGQARIAGSQSLTVTLRGVFLGDVRPRHWPSVAGKEIAGGLLNGLLVSLVAAAGVHLWSGSQAMALVTALALLASMVISGVAGGLLPLLLRAIGRNPARASMLLLNTLSDVVGIFAFLGLATWMFGLT